MKNVKLTDVMLSVIPEHGPKP